MLWLLSTALAKYRLDWKKRRGAWTCSLVGFEPWKYKVKLSRREETGREGKGRSCCCFICVRFTATTCKLFTSDYSVPSLSLFLLVYLVFSLPCPLKLLSNGATATNIILSAHAQQINWILSGASSKRVAVNGGEFLSWCLPRGLKRCKVRFDVYSRCFSNQFGWSQLKISQADESWDHFRKRERVRPRRIDNRSIWAKNSQVQIKPVNKLTRSFTSCFSSCSYFEPLTNTLRYGKIAHCTQN